MAHVSGRLHGGAQLQQRLNHLDVAEQCRPVQRRPASGREAAVRLGLFLLNRLWSHAEGRIFQRINTTTIINDQRFAVRDSCRYSKRKK